MDLNREQVEDARAAAKRDALIAGIAPASWSERIDAVFDLALRGLQCQWRPIETAPRDGTEFQAWIVRDVDGNGFIKRLCRFNEDECFQSYGRVDYDCDGWDSLPASFTAKLWLPLPSPPEGK